MSYVPRQPASRRRRLANTNVIDLDGGMNAWKTSGHLLVDDPSAAKEK